MRQFCKVGHLFYSLKILGPGSIEIGEQLYEDELRQEMIEEVIRRHEFETSQILP